MRTALGVNPSQWETYDNNKVKLYSQAWNVPKRHRRADSRGETGSGHGLGQPSFAGPFRMHRNHRQIWGVSGREFFVLRAAERRPVLG